MSSAGQGEQQQQLQVPLAAVYTAPGSSHKFTRELPFVSTAPTTAGKTSYLSALRAAVPKLQEDINIFLTRKMEEDKAAAGSASTSKIDEQKEEEQYGEEVVEEED